MRLLAALLFCLSSGCSLFGGLRVDAVASGSQRPSNVAAYLSVTDGDEPVTNLVTKDFTLYEDGKPLSLDETRQVLLDGDQVATHRALLLVDASLANTADAKANLEKAVAGFVEKVRPTQAVSVFAFDGDAALKPVGDYAQASSGGIDVSRLASMRTADPSRNLNGALLRAISELERRLGQNQKPVRVGTLVVFAHGPDRAGRAEARDVDRALDERDFAVIAIGVGADADADVRALGRDGFVAAQSSDTLGIAFEEAAYKVRAERERHYLLAYCSPARAGKRVLRVEVRFSNKQGDEKRGDTEVEFDAQGFGSGCSPERLPRLSSTRAKPKNADHKPAPTSTPGVKDSATDALPGDDATAEPAESGSEEGPVVPPPKRPGYAQ